MHAKMAAFAALVFFPLGWTAALWAVDRRILDFAGRHPGFWEQAGVHAAFASGLLALAGGLAWLGRRRRENRQPALSNLGCVALLAGILAGQLFLRITPVGPGREARLEGYEGKTGIEVTEYVAAAGTLVQRIAMAVPIRGRVALIHTPDQTDIPVFLSFVLCPRLFYLFKDRVPEPEELRREGIRWVVDMRSTSFRTQYREAVIRKVPS